MNRMKRSFKSVYLRVSELYSVFTMIPDVPIFTLTSDYNLVNLRIKEFIAKSLECEWNHSHIHSRGFQMCILLKGTSVKGTFLTLQSIYRERWYSPGSCLGLKQVTCCTVSSIQLYTVQSVKH